MLRNRNSTFCNPYVPYIRCWKYFYFILNPIAGIISVITFLLIMGCSFFYTFRRYEEIKLSNYLRMLSNGDHALDIRDNRRESLVFLKMKYTR